jgi:hypothetical protein
MHLHFAVEVIAKDKKDFNTDKKINIWKLYPADNLPLLVGWKYTYPSLSQLLG